VKGYIAQERAVFALVVASRIPGRECIAQQSAGASQQTAFRAHLPSPIVAMMSHALHTVAFPLAPSREHPALAAEPAGVANHPSSTNPKNSSTSHFR